MKNNLRALFWSSRPVSWINTAFPFAAAYLVTTGAVDARFVIGTLYFLIPYNLLMYGINDVFDYESDLHNPRKGGIEGAQLDKTTHTPILIAAAVLNIPFIVALLWLGDVLAGAVLLAVMFFVLAYSLPKLRFKERPFLDSATSAAHFAGPAVYAFALTEFSPVAVLVLTAFFLWAMASHAFGAVQDVQSDHSAGIDSIATAIGPRRTVWFAIMLYALSAALVATLGLPALIVSLLLLLYIANIFPCRTLTNMTAFAANRAWRRFIYLNPLTGTAVTVVLLFSTQGQ